jgi:hypothetical protein
MHILTSVDSLSDSLCTSFQTWISSQTSLIVFILYVILIAVDRARIASTAIYGVGGSKLTPRWKKMLAFTRIGHVAHTAFAQWLLGFSRVKRSIGFVAYLAPLLPRLTLIL